MTKWSNIIAKPGGSCVDGMSCLIWNQIMNDGSNAGIGVPGYGDEHGFLPDSNAEYGPDGIPYYVNNVCYVKCWKPGVLTGGIVDVRFNSNFVAPFNMVLTKFKFRGRQDIGFGTATTWGAQLRIIVKGRQKRIRPEVGHLLEKEFDLWNYLDPANQFAENTLTIRPLVVPKGANVTIQLHMNIAVVAYATDWIRIGNVQIGYRAPMDNAVFNHSYGGQTKSWLTRKECLPDDSMKLSVRILDAEGTEVGNNTPIKCFHNGAAINPFPILLSSEGVFDTFNVTSSPSVETLKCTSDDADGIDGNWLGAERTYDDKVLGLMMDGDTQTYPDDDPYNNIMNLPAIFDSFTVAKRTPIVRFSDLPSRINLGTLFAFQGYLEDPEQSSMIEFLDGIPTQLQRLDNVWMPLETPNSDGNGNFAIQHTMGVPDLGLNKRWKIVTASTTQYNIANSLIKSTNVMEIIQTLFSQFEFEKPHIIRNEPATFKFKLVDAASSLGVSGSPAVKIQRLEQAQWIDVHTQTLNADGTGSWTWPEASSLLPGDLESITTDFRAVFEGSTDQWKEYVPASPSAISSLTISAVPLGLGSLILGAKMDNKSFSELTGTKTINFKLNEGKTDYYGVSSFDQETGIIVNPDRYSVTCTLTLVDFGLTFTKTEIRNVAADQDVLLTFSFFSQGQTDGGKGRIEIVLTSSDTFIVLGESVTFNGSVSYPSRIRTMPVRFVKMKIKSGDEVLATARTGMDGTFTTEITPTTIGPLTIYAELSGPLGLYPIATSGELLVTVMPA